MRAAFRSLRDNSRRALSRSKKNRCSCLHSLAPPGARLQSIPHPLSVTPAHGADSCEFEAEAESFREHVVSSMLRSFFKIISVTGKCCNVYSTSFRRLTPELGAESKKSLKLLLPTLSCPHRRYCCRCGHSGTVSISLALCVLRGPGRRK